MAKASKKIPEKKRAEKYEPKVSFDGTFEDMIGLSVKDAEKTGQQQGNADKKEYAK